MDYKGVLVACWFPVEGVNLRQIYDNDIEPAFTGHANLSNVTGPGVLSINLMSFKFKLEDKFALFMYKYTRIGGHN